MSPSKIDSGTYRMIQTIEKTEVIKLNLGGRTRTIKGFLNVDLYDGPEVDIKTDITKLDMFKDGSVDELYCSHCLEHTPHPRTVDVLKEWRRVLKPLGKAYIAVPDFAAMVELYKKIGMNDFIRNFLWGDQIYDFAFHYTGFDYPYLARFLSKAGFTDVKRIQNMPYGIVDCSSLRDTIFGKPVSLNIEATA
jgi:SAM-dependent methyltransferase